MMVVEQTQVCRISFELTKPNQSTFSDPEFMHSYGACACESVTSVVNSQSHAVKQ